MYELVMAAGKMAFVAACIAYDLDSQESEIAWSLLGEYEVPKTVTGIHTVMTNAIEEVLRARRD